MCEWNPFIFSKSRTQSFFLNQFLSLLCHSLTHTQTHTRTHTQLPSKHITCTVALHSLHFWFYKGRTPAHWTKSRRRVSGESRDQPHGKSLQRRVSLPVENNLVVQFCSLERLCMFLSPIRYMSVRLLVPDKSS